MRSVVLVIVFALANIILTGGYKKETPSEIESRADAGDARYQAKMAEVLGETFRHLRMDDEVFEGMPDALETAYEDRLREVIDEHMCKRKSGQWRSELQAIEIELEAMREATESYHEEGVRLLELTQVAHGHYVTANP
jgi:hypothetical protein